MPDPPDARHATLPLAVQPGDGGGDLLAHQGALVEAWLEGGEALTCPSVQGLIHPGGTVEVISTHEQILGGVSGQTYLGCTFPTADAFRVELMRMGAAIGQGLAAEGPWSALP